MIAERTEVESTANGGDDKLDCPQSTHDRQNGAVLVEDGMNSDNVSSWRNRVRRGS